MRARDDMLFPMEEHHRRLRGLRERMGRWGLDVVVITDPENLFYLTEYQTTGYSYFQALVVPIEDEPFMVTRKLEETNVVARTWVDITRPFSDTGDAIETLWNALTELGQIEGKRIGYERNSYFFPAYQQDRMTASWYDADFVDCFGIVEEGRLIKSPIEIEVMRRAARAGEIGMRAGLDAVCEGVNENELAAVICAAMFEAGSEYPAVLPYVTSGPRCMIGHATWEGRRVEAGDTVFLEVGGCVRRYHAAMMRTAFVGDPPDAVREAEKLVLEAL
ncbi:MAG: aminopeptidase P family protein, partial [Myxococcales bacterium]|nr:aminopeptidase P family protein [Myxococcales bacterium]